MITTTIYHRWAGGGCGWYIADEDSQSVLADGYARTLLGARWAVARRHVWWWLRYTPGQLSYAIRPYDMLADRRRWFWQRRQRCGIFR